MAILKLKKKGVETQSQWQDAWEHIDTLVSREELNTLTEKTLDEMTRVLKRYPNAAYGWSGGKDSLVLSHLCEQVGVKAGVWGTMSPVELKAFMDWAHAHKPEGIEHVDNPAITLRYLAFGSNRKYVFPPTFAEDRWWTANGTRRAQHIYMQYNSPDVMLVGRTRADGNYIPENGLMPSAYGLFFSPMRFWPIEFTMAYLHYHQLPMPPNYTWREGWAHGSGGWAGWKMPSKIAGFRYLAEVDKTPLVEASEFFPEAAQVLMELENPNRSDSDNETHGG